MGIVWLWHIQIMKLVGNVEKGKGRDVGLKRVTEAFCCEPVL